MKKIKEKYNIFCNKVKLYLCELKKKDIKFSDIVKFLFKILTLIFLFCVLVTTIFKSCSNSNQNQIEPKKQLKSEVRANEEISPIELKINTDYIFRKDIYLNYSSSPVVPRWRSVPITYNTSFYTSINVNFIQNIIQFLDGDGMVYTIYENTWLNYAVLNLHSIPDSKNAPFEESLYWFLAYNLIEVGTTSDCPSTEPSWCYDGKRNGIYKFTDTLFSKTQISTLLFDFSSYGGNFNKLMVNKGVLSYGNDTETYQVALFNSDTNKWEFTHNEDKYINLRHFQTENDYIQFDLQLIKGNILENISFEQFQKEIAKSAFDAGVDLTQTTNNSIVLFFTQLFQLPYMIFTTLFSPFTFELGGISINLGATLLGLMLVLLIVWVMKKFK